MSLKYILSPRRLAMGPLRIARKLQQVTRKTQCSPMFRPVDDHRQTHAAVRLGKALHDRRKHHISIALEQPHGAAVDKGCQAFRQTIGKPQGNIIFYIRPIYYQYDILINMNQGLSIFGQYWQPQAMFRSRWRPQAFFSSFLFRCAFWEKARFGVPKPCLQLNRWPQVFLFMTCLFEKGTI